MLASSEIKVKSLELKLIQKSKAFEKLEDSLRQIVETNISIQKREILLDNQEDIDTSITSENDEVTLQNYLTKVQHINVGLLDQLHDYQAENKSNY